MLPIMTKETHAIWTRFFLCVYKPSMRLGQLLLVIDEIKIMFLFVVLSSHSVLSSNKRFVFLFALKNIQRQQQWVDCCDRNNLSWLQVKLEDKKGRRTTHSWKKNYRNGLYVWTVNRRSEKGAFHCVISNVSATSADWCKLNGNNRLKTVNNRQARKKCVQRIRPAWRKRRKDTMKWGKLNIRWACHAVWLVVGIEKSLR